MGKKADNAFYDAAFSWLQSNSIRMAACSAEPANYAGIAAVRLAEVTMAPGDFAIANGDVSGRKVTVAAKSGVSITTSGTANHIVLHNNSAILGYVTTCTALPLTAGAGNTVNFPAWKIEVAAPS